jgi:hypothetical protein
VNSILPGMLVNALITSVSPAGLMLQILGSFNGTVDTFHMTRQQLEDAKVGSKVRCISYSSWAIAKQQSDSRKSSLSCPICRAP